VKPGVLASVRCLFAFFSVNERNRDFSLIKVAPLRRQPLQHMTNSGVGWSIYCNLQNVVRSATIFVAAFGKLGIECPEMATHSVIFFVETDCDH